jgi:hypothetical protein
MGDKKAVTGYVHLFIFLFNWFIRMCGRVLFTAIQVSNIMLC